MVGCFWKKDIAKKPLLKECHWFTKPKNFVGKILQINWMQGRSAKTEMFLEERYCEEASIKTV